MKSLCTLFGLLLFLSSFSLSGQSSSGQMEVSLFELRDNNIQQVAQDVINLMQTQRVAASNIPSASTLNNFLSTPFTTPLLSYDEFGCSTPGLEVYQNAGNYNFQFRNLANNQGQGQLLFVASLKYGDGSMMVENVVFADQIFSGGSFLPSDYSGHVILVGTLCPLGGATSSSASAQFSIGRVEILIVDKNIL
ncbi:MAG: hypothetical protein AAF990_25520 [Bacteroidota bacterium]